ncbi:MAG: aromatic amino acid transport family protein, partial [Cyanobacteria bacterium J06632_3]
MAPLFSNLASSDSALVHQPGNVLSCIALVAGTTVGAGILALPAVTLPAGVVPSTVLMVGVWLYMVVTGLLIAEVNLYVMGQTGRPDVGLLATIRWTLGKAGAIAAGILYIFIHYALLVAYIARGGDILGAAIRNVARLGIDAITAIPLETSLAWGHVIFVSLLGGL